jgi:ABC-type multidrug transport system fused ATPase/permease subunit
LQIAMSRSRPDESMLNRKIAGYIAFARQCLALLGDERAMFLAFIGVSLLGALSEGLGISLLAPVLDALSGRSGFADVPILGQVSGLFAGLAPDVRIQAVAIAIALVTVLRNALQYVIDVMSAIFPLRLERKLALRGYAALMAVEIAYIQEKDYGTHANAMSGWPGRVTSMLNNLSTIVWSLMTVIVYGVMMVVVSWQLTALAVIFVLIVSAALKWFFSGVLHRAGTAQTAAQTSLSQAIMESLTGMKVVRLTAAEPLMTGRLTRALDRLNWLQRRIAKITALGPFVMATAAGLFICALLYGSAVVHGGEPAAWVASLLLFLFLLSRLMGPVNRINLARSYVVANMNAFDMLNAFYREADERRQPNGSRIAAPLRQGIVLDDVSFAYQSREATVIDRLSVKIERGKTVAIVGPSGAGKTTLIGLVTRLYDPQQGRILVDGVDLRDLEVRSWRQRLAVVTQDTFIFNDTVAHNIGFGRENVPTERIEGAAKLAAASDFIEQLPQKYETSLGDRGVRLSGGQQQRIAIARAILADPDLLIFDEATSHLDIFTEREIQAAMGRLSQNRTLMVVAHRLSTIRNADIVLVMDKGVLVEQGTHRELLARRGIYWQMVMHQRLDLAEGEAEMAAAEADA